MPDTTVETTKEMKANYTTPFMNDPLFKLIFPAPYGTTISRMPQDILHPNMMMDPSLDPSGRGKKVNKFQ